MENQKKKGLKLEQNNKEKSTVATMPKTKKHRLNDEEQLYEKFLNYNVTRHLPFKLR